MKLGSIRLVVRVSALALATACSSTSVSTHNSGSGGMDGTGGGPMTPPENTGGGRTGAGGTGGSVILPGQDASFGGAYTGDGAAPGTGMLPSDFTPTDVGGFKLGGRIDGPTDATAAQPGPDGCGGIIIGVLRDFRPWQVDGGHHDFEVFWGNSETTGLVANELGADKKPVYASKCEQGTVSFATDDCPYGAETTTKANFDQWYRNTPNVNEAFLLYMFLAPNGGVFTFHDALFYPLDDVGFGNSGMGRDMKMHNFHFTTEVHTQFKYAGGETFSFTGDDDLWVFINNKLAIDLGGLHSQASQSIALDAVAAKLGITKTNVYPLDLFHAERRTDESHFRIDTDLDFVNCGELPPDIH
jgi:fibro-slime domain-containing protein